MKMLLIGMILGLASVSHATAEEAFNAAQATVAQVNTCVEEGFAANGGAYQKYIQTNSQLVVASIFQLDTAAQLQKDTEAAGEAFFTTAKPQNTVVIAACLEKYIPLKQLQAEIQDMTDFPILGLDVEPTVYAYYGLVMQYLNVVDQEGTQKRFKAELEKIFPGSLDAKSLPALVIKGYPAKVQPLLASVTLPMVIGEVLENAPGYADATKWTFEYATK